jgi:hypothetical protein
MHSNQRKQTTRATFAVSLRLSMVILSTIALWSFSSPQVVAAQQDRARVRAEGFSFVPPAGWQRSTNLPSTQVRLLYIGPTERSFRANVNLVVEQDGGESFDEFAKQAKAIFPKMFSSWTVEEESPIEINGKKTYYLSATYRMAGYTLRGAQFFVRGGNGKVYVLTFTTASQAFERLGPAIAQSAMSIQIE